MILWGTVVTIVDLAVSVVGMVFIFLPMIFPMVVCSRLDWVLYPWQNHDISGIVESVGFDGYADGGQASNFSSYIQFCVSPPV
jgi:hypothetical protein